MNDIAAIRTNQVRAARALLDWNQTDLATAAGLSLTTIKKFEVGERSAQFRTKTLIVRALQARGIRFINEPRRVGVSIALVGLPPTYTRRSPRS